MDDDDVFLRSLWQPTGNDSFFDRWDEKSAKARKEVMSHLVEMMSTAPCPKEGENTSNLYRILVKKLRQRVSSLENNPDIAELATKKIAKWVEGLVKEAYYRKQGKIKPKFDETTDIDTDEIQRINVEERIVDAYEDKQKPNQPEMVHIRGKPRKKVIIDGKEYVLMEEKSKEKTKNVDYPSSILKKKSNFSLSEDERPKSSSDKRKQFETMPPAASLRPLAQKDALNPKRTKTVPKEEEILLSEQVLLSRNKYLKNYKTTSDSEVEEEERRKKPLKEAKHKPLTTETSTSTPAESSNDEAERGSATALIKNWSSWMMNLTKRARSLVKWDKSVLDTLTESEVKDPAKHKASIKEKIQKRQVEKAKEQASRGTRDMNKDRKDRDSSD